MSLNINLLFVNGLVYKSITFDEFMEITKKRVEETEAFMEKTRPYVEKCKQDKIDKNKQDKNIIDGETDDRTELLQSVR
jgi:hypothetical protein